MTGGSLFRPDSAPLPVTDLAEVLAEVRLMRRVHADMADSRARVCLRDYEKERKGKAGKV